MNPPARKVLVAPPDADAVAPGGRRLDALSRRIDTDESGVEKGLAQLVLAIVELLRQLMERQALHRMDADTLSVDEIERLGRTFLALKARMDELELEFGLEDDDLNLNLGPLGNLM